MLYYEKEEFLMGCSMSTASRGHHHHHHRHEEDDGWGILIGHAYAVLAVKEVRSKGKTERLVKIRNPWGQKEWKGAFSDGSREWTAELRRELNHADADDDIASTLSSGSSNGGSTRPSPSKADAGGRRCRGNTIEPWCQYARPES